MLDFLVKSPNHMVCLLEKLKKHSKPVYLFGAGNCGANYLNVLEENEIPVEAFLDDNAQKQKNGFCGKPVLSPEDMVGRNGTILISSYGPSILMKRLEKIDPDLPKRVLWSEFYLWEHGLDYYSYYMEHASELEKVYSLLEDERSKEVFRNLLNYKISRNIHHIEEICDLGKYDQYFDMSILRLGQDEVFVDLGAYIGDTVDSFVKHVKNAGGSYTHMYAFEPDQGTFQELKKHTAHYENITYVNKGAYHENTVLRFSSDTGMQTSAFNVNGDIEVSVCSLDEEIKSKVTFIKADIEGCEMHAIKGAENLIRQYKPTIAFCIYHRKDDIFNIPLYLHKLNNGYKFYMRHYSEIPVESVVYAIDNSRV